MMTGSELTYFAVVSSCAIAVIAAAIHATDCVIKLKRHKQVEESASEVADLAKQSLRTEFDNLASLVREARSVRAELQELRVELYHFKETKRQLKRDSLGRFKK